MAHLFVIPQVFSEGANGKRHISGMWISSDILEPNAFDAEVEFTDSPATINQAMIDGAIAQAANFFVEIDPEVDTIRVSGALA